MTPELIAVVLGAGLLALLPARRLAGRTPARGLVTAWFVGLWLAIVVASLVPAARRLAVPLAVVLAVAPWLEVPDALQRWRRRSVRDRR